MTMLGCESRDLRTRDVMELVTLDYVIVDYFKVIGLIRLFVNAWTDDDTNQTEEVHHMPMGPGMGLLH